MLQSEQEHHHWLFPDTYIEDCIISFKASTEDPACFGEPIKVMLFRNAVFTIRYLPLGAGITPKGANLYLH